MFSVGPSVVDEADPADVPGASAEADLALADLPGAAAESDPADVPGTAAVSSVAGEPAFGGEAPAAPFAGEAPAAPFAFGFGLLPGVASKRSSMLSTLVAKAARFATGDSTGVSGPRFF